MRVEVYWNLHKHLFSVRALEGEHKGRVIGHTYGLTLVEAKFAVQPAGRERTRREKRKNVHAFVRGHVAVPLPEGRPHLYTALARKVVYNPYKYNTFVDAETKCPVFKGDIVEMGMLYSDRFRFPHILVFDKISTPS